MSKICQKDNRDVTGNIEIGNVLYNMNKEFFTDVTPLHNPDRRKDMEIVYMRQSKKMKKESIYHYPEFYGLLGFILVVSISIIYLFTIESYDLSINGLDTTMNSDIFLLCIINIAAMTLWGFYEYKILGRFGSITLIAISIFSAYILILLGSISLFMAIIFRNFNRDDNND